MYLLYPAVQGVNWYDFHPEALLLVSILFSLYFLESNNTFGYFVSFLLGLMCLEFAPIIFYFHVDIFRDKNEAMEEAPFGSKKTIVTSLDNLNLFVVVVFKPSNNSYFLTQLHAP